MGYALVVFISCAFPLMQDLKLNLVSESPNRLGDCYIWLLKQKRTKILNLHPFWDGLGGIRTPDTVVRSHVL